MSDSQRVGWFADADNWREGDHGERMDGWQPCLETGTGFIPTFDVWFKTREECERFIRDEILPIARKMLPDHP